MSTQESNIPVYFDYCGTPGDYMVILRTLIVGQYVCDVGYIHACKPSDECTGGYHIVGISGKGRGKLPTHYETKEVAAQALFELWRKSV